MTCIETAKKDMMANETMIVPSAVSIGFPLSQFLLRNLPFMLPVSK